MAWGSGFAWNPTNRLERPKNPLNTSLDQEGAARAAPGRGPHGLGRPHPGGRAQRDGRRRPALRRPGRSPHGWRGPRALPRARHRPGPGRLRRRARSAAGRARPRTHGAARGWRCTPRRRSIAGAEMPPGARRAHLHAPGHGPLYRRALRTRSPSSTSSTARATGRRAGELATSRGSPSLRPGPRPTTAARRSRGGAFARYLGCRHPLLGRPGAAPPLRTGLVDARGRRRGSGRPRRGRWSGSPTAGWPSPRASPTRRAANRHVALDAVVLFGPAGQRVSSRAPARRRAGAREGPLLMKQPCSRVEDVTKDYELGRTRVPALRGVTLASTRASSWRSPGRPAPASPRS